MAQSFDRRHFLRDTLTASAALSVGVNSFEEKHLLAQASAEAVPHRPDRSGGEAKMPQGKLGDVSVSRVICGGNLICYFAHSRDLIYVSPLLKHYFTDEKVFSTFDLCQQEGINTAILRYDERTVRLLKQYWGEFDENWQWIAQLKPKVNVVGITPATENLPSGTAVKPDRIAYSFRGRVRPPAAPQASEHDLHLRHELRDEVHRAARSGQELANGGLHLDVLLEVAEGELPAALVLEAAADLGAHDPGAIVWDEIVGFLVAMYGLPRRRGWLAAGFVVYRLFDVWKPYPIGVVEESFGTGVSIMADDVIAGFYALLVLHLVRWAVKR